MAQMMETDLNGNGNGNGRDGSDKIRLQTMRDVLVESIDITEITESKVLLDLLSDEDIFNTDERDRVTNESGNEDQIHTLLDILETKVDETGRDPRVLDIFVDYLRDCVDEDLAKELIEADGIPQASEEAEEAIRLAGGPEEAIKLAEGMELSEKILSGVIRQIGTAWLSVAHELGMNSIVIKNLTHKISDSYEEKSIVFNAWKQKKWISTRELDCSARSLKGFRSVFRRVAQHMSLPQSKQTIILNHQ